ncbi:MAG: hypothetical protein ACTSVB_11330 [Candidatus Heimdallarchaeaceae archaeon]
MKAQYLTVEYVIFFAIGVLMIISIYYIFSNLNQIFEKSVIENQLMMVGELLRGVIVNTFEISNSTNTTIYYNLTIPPRLSNYNYWIKVEDNSLKLNCSDVPIGIALSLYNFNTTTKNIIYSTKNLVEILVRNGKVELK